MKVTCPASWLPLARSDASSLATPGTAIAVFAVPPPDVAPEDAWAPDPAPALVEVGRLAPPELHPVMRSTKQHPATSAPAFKYGRIGLSSQESSIRRRSRPAVILTIPHRARGWVACCFCALS